MKLKILFANKKVLLGIIMLLLLAPIALGADIFTYSNRNDAYVARVNGVGITKDIYNQQLASLHFFITSLAKKSMKLR